MIINIFYYTLFFVIFFARIEKKIHEKCQKIRKYFTTSINLFFNFSRKSIILHLIMNWSLNILFFPSDFFFCVDAMPPFARPVLQRLNALEAEDDTGPNHV